jgi:hypothetical protein
VEDSLALSVVGTHTYADARSYQVQVSVGRVTPVAPPRPPEPPRDPSVVAITYPNVTETVESRFVNRLHFDLLGRGGSSAEVSRWLIQLTQGAPREQVVRDIEASAEYRIRLVQVLYQSLLDRDGEANGQEYWVNFLAAGHTLEEMKAGFLGSQEYIDKHAGGVWHYLDAVYQDALGRSLDAAGQTYWTGLLNSSISATDVAHQILTSEEGVRARVGELYQQFLERSPDEDGMRYFAGRIAQGASNAELLQAILASDEYFRLA